MEKGEPKTIMQIFIVGTPWVSQGLFCDIASDKRNMRLRPHGWFCSYFVKKCTLAHGLPCPKMGPLILKNAGMWPIFHFRKNETGLLRALLQFLTVPHMVEKTVAK